MQTIIKRVPTGIKNFDEHIDGGLPEGFTVLLAGGPGTGKSIFGLEYLFNGAKEFGENGIYVSLEEKAESLKKQALMFGWDFESLGEKAEIRFLAPGGTVNSLLDTIHGYAKILKAKRLVIDSFTTLFSVAAAYGEEIEGGRQIVKKDVLDFFSKIKAFNCTTLLISEIPTATEKLSEDGMSEFACDGIILLKRTTMGSEEVRTMSVLKMRQTKTKSGNLNLSIEDDGIIIERQ